MPQEEEGFTFVDKRGSQVESAAVEAPSAGSAVTDPIPDSAQPAEDDSDMDGPPDTYSLIGYCVSLLSSDAWQKLGLLADPNTGEAQADLQQAKVAIDAVGDLAAHLEAAPVDAIPDSVRRDLRTLLQDLRLNFVAQQNKST